MTTAHLLISRRGAATSVAGAALALAVLAGGPASANVINGGFETGDFSGWATLGDTSIKTAAFGSGPTEGSHDALINNDGYHGTGLVESFLGLSFGTLSAAHPGYGPVWTGSAIKQSITVAAGDKLTFDWNFLTQEEDPTPYYNDFAFFSISSSATVLADTLYSIDNSGTPFNNETGFDSMEYVFGAGGTYTVGFGAMQVGDVDPNWTSALLLDNVEHIVAVVDDHQDDPPPPPPYTAVPEPTTLAMFGLGLLGLGIVRRRRG